MKENVALIGMAGCGKTVAGKMLAKSIGYAFLDTDDYIVGMEGRPIQDIISDIGDEDFAGIEEKRVLGLNPKKCIISTGGSVVLSEKAIRHLKESSVMVFLYAPFEVLESRLHDRDTRGIVGLQSRSLREVYDSRLPLYRKYADLTIDSSDTDYRRVADKIAGELKTQFQF